MKNCGLLQAGSRVSFSHWTQSCSFWVLGMGNIQVRREKLPQSLTRMKCHAVPSGLQPYIRCVLLMPAPCTPNSTEELVVKRSNSLEIRPAQNFALTFWKFSKFLRMFDANSVKATKEPGSPSLVPSALSFTTISVTFHTYSDEAASPTFLREAAFHPTFPPWLFQSLNHKEFYFLKYSDTHSTSWFLPGITTRSADQTLSHALKVEHSSTFYTHWNAEGAWLTDDGGGRFTRWGFLCRQNGKPKFQGTPVCTAAQNSRWYRYRSVVESESSTAVVICFLLAPCVAHLITQHFHTVQQAQSQDKCSISKTLLALASTC